MRVCAAQERPTIAALASEFALDRDASYATQRTSWRSPEQSRLPAHEDEPRQPTYVRPRIDRRDEAVQRKRDREASRYPRPREWRALPKAASHKCRSTLRRRSSRTTGSRSPGRRSDAVRIRASHLTVLTAVAC